MKLERSQSRDRQLGEIVDAANFLGMLMHIHDIEATYAEINRLLSNAG